MYLYGIIIPLFSCLLQIWPRLKNRYFGVDTWRHLMYADYIRRYKRLPDSITDRYIVSGPFGYPPVILFFLAIFPKKFCEDYQFLFSPFFDFLHNYFIFVIALLLSGNLLVAIIAQIIACLTPVIVIEASNLNTRIISYLLFSISFFSLIYFSITASPIWLFIAGIGLFILFFTHRFALQAYIFNVIGFSIVEKTPFYLGFFIGVTFLVVVFGGKLYRSILKEHMRLLTYWIQRIEYRYGHQFRGPKKIQKMDFIFFLYNFSTKFPFIYIIGQNPWLLFFIVLLINNIFVHYQLSSTLSNIVLFKFSVWVLLSMGTSILILWIKQLRFLGEGYRYTEYAIFPLSIILASYFPFLQKEFKGNFIILFALTCIFFLAVIIFLQIKTILRDRYRTIDKEKWEVIAYLNKQNNNRIAVFPSQIGDAIMYFVKGRILTSDSVFGLEQIPDIFPKVTKSMEEIVKKYKLNFIFFDKRFVLLEEMRLKNYTVILDKNDYMLLKVN